ncbi:SRPBCC family protein [Gordonia sp. LSe1-13]|uniref:SRPBCC family protein n=1 Tax=Gordonia sesuvii TaxID=3116777 RepID=A0ABU7MBP5_9ACTN|nr:SRPBCC family protein [Gordonia sp. LSe1-13]
MSTRAQIADVRVRVPASPHAAFDYLSDPRNRPHWQSSLRGIDELSEPGDRRGDVGTSWIDRTVVPGVSPRLEVVDYRPGVRWSEIGGWHVIDALLTLSFTDVDGGTEVRAQAYLTVPSVLGPAVLALRLLTPGALRHDLHRAAALLAAESPSA